MTSKVAVGWEVSTLYLAIGVPAVVDVALTIVRFHSHLKVLWQRQVSSKVV